MFYKIVYNNFVIDIIDNPVYVKYSFKSKMFLVTDATSADGVMSGNREEVYLFKAIPDIEYKIVKMVEITESEYLNIKSNIVEPINADGEVVDFYILQQNKIDEMNLKCRESIIDGFDVVLSDGVSYHFSLEITDQLKITKLNMKALAGGKDLSWHCDDGLYKFYSAADVITIHNKMEETIDYHTVYFNSLKNYIKNLTDKNTLLNIYYGIEIPKEYQSEVFLALNDESN